MIFFSIERRRDLPTDSETTQLKAAFPPACGEPAERGKVTSILTAPLG